MNTTLIRVRVQVITEHANTSEVDVTVEREFTTPDALASVAREAVARAEAGANA